MARLRNEETRRRTLSQRVILVRKMSLKWSYGDSNPGPLACHSSSKRRSAMLDVLLAGNLPLSCGRVMLSARREQERIDRSHRRIGHSAR
jgi:hypothetical protein